MVPSASVVVLGMETRRRRGGVGLAPSYGAARQLFTVFRTGAYAVYITTGSLP